MDTDSLRDTVAALIWDHLRPIEDTTPLADAILAIPEIKEALTFRQIQLMGGKPYGQFRAEMLGKSE